MTPSLIAQQTPLQQGATQDLAAQKKYPPQIEKAARDFEAMFMTEMMGYVFNGLEVDSSFGGGRGEEIFRGMIVQEYGKMMSHNGPGIGIAKDIKEALLKMQEAS